MSDEDRRHWDARYIEGGIAPVGHPPGFASFEHLFPTGGVALELACGRGRSALWLASRGMEVYGVDLDGGLPECPPVDLLLCHRFRDPRLDRAMIDRVAPDGLLAVAVMSEVGVGPGPFRAQPGELRRAFGELELVVGREGEGMACILARRSGSPSSRC